MADNIDSLFEQWLNSKDLDEDNKNEIRKDPKSKLLFIQNMDRLMIKQDANKFPPELPKQPNAAPMNLSEGAYATKEDRDKLKRQKFAGMSPEMVRTGANVLPAAGLGAMAGGPIGAATGAASGIGMDILDRLTDDPSNPQQFGDASLASRAISPAILNRINKLKSVGTLGKSALGAGYMGAENMGVEAANHPEATLQDKMQTGGLAALVGGGMNAIGNSVAKRTQQKISREELEKLLSSYNNPGQSTKAAANTMTQRSGDLQYRLAKEKEAELLKQGLSDEQAIHLGIDHGNQFLQTPQKLTSIASGSPEKIFTSVVEPLKNLSNPNLAQQSAKQFRDNFDELLMVADPKDKPEIVAGVRHALIRDVLKSSPEAILSLGSDTIERVFSSKFAAQKLQGIVEGIQDQSTGSKVKLFAQQNGDLGVLLKVGNAISKRIPSSLGPAGLGAGVGMMLPGVGLTAGALGGAAAGVGLNAGYKMYSIGADQLARMLSSGNNRIPEVLSALATNRGTYSDQSVKTLEKYLDKTYRYKLPEEEEKKLTRQSIGEIGQRVLGGVRKTKKQIEDELGNINIPNQ